ncbi:hypothetical protein ACX1NX_02990 [Acinetobacter sp. ANC 5383]
MHSGFKSCLSCREQYDQCLVCHFYTVDGERIYYQKLENFGATNDSEVRFIQRIQRHSTIAFFHNGKLHIPSRQGRVVPLAIGLQWEAWQEQQKRIDELTVGCGLQRDHIRGLEDGIKKSWAKVAEKDMRIDVALEMANESCGVNPAAYRKLYKILKGGDE